MRMSTRATKTVVCFLAMAFGWVLLSSSSPAATNEIQTVAEIRNLPVEQTNQKLPVRLHGVMTFFVTRVDMRIKCPQSVTMRNNLLARCDG